MRVDTSPMDDPRPSSVDMVSARRNTRVHSAERVCIPATCASHAERWAPNPALSVATLRPSTSRGPG
jgi:hypothetical protein